MELNLPVTTDKTVIMAAVQTYLDGASLGIASIDAERPWGGFFVIDESQTADFIARYFADLPQAEIERGGKLSPKILVVEPAKRLSWQYHDRREELWHVLVGPVGVVTSETDEQGEPYEVFAGEQVQFGTNIRHRLIGLEQWGIVAEIWQHTDASNPSDEDDIVRVADDFKR
jgi:mannose-6-phosphate isomerase